ncbi:hypothetical protein A7U60_g2471 [Sanghuangporus baumii]|uniref:DUF6534 domain-containing protein n=1 Tax=Sanghuangporus baumii TaxID=108892 RepID=A0A9Q5I238_SANBA|nr:hypothetical protein A7U60_g2471 [Sanghuangporus baumii]
MAVPRAQLELDSTFGCLYLSVVFSMGLWGAGCVQMYFYYEIYSETDKWQLKLYIFLAWALDTAHEALLIQSLYIYLVKEYGNVLFLAHPQRTLIDESPFAGVVAFMVQLVFIVRVWYLSNKNHLLTGFLVTIVLAQLGTSLSYFGQVYHFTNAAQLLGVLNTERALHALIVVADMLIAVVLIYLLWNRRSGIRKTDSIIKRLIIYTISTGLVASLWGLIGLVGNQVLPSSFIYLLIDLVMPKLYFNCMLASLNARSSIRENLMRDGGAMSIRLENLPSNSVDRPSGSDSRARKSASPRDIECKIDIVVQNDYQGRQVLEEHSS